MACHIHRALKSHSPCQLQLSGKPLQLLAWQFEDYCFGAELVKIVWVDGQRERLRTSWLVRGKLGGKQAAHFINRKLPLRLMKHKGISPSRFVSLLFPAALPFLCRALSFWAGAYTILSVNDPSFCQPPSLTRLFHSSPSLCQFPQHIRASSLEGFLKFNPFRSSHSNHHSSHHHYLHSGLLELPLGYHSVSPFALIPQPTFLKKKLFVYLVAPDLSCSPCDFFFLVQHVEFLVVACDISCSDQGSNPGPCIGVQSLSLDCAGSVPTTFYVLSRGIF